MKYKQVPVSYSFYHIIQSSSNLYFYNENVSNNNVKGVARGDGLAEKSAAPLGFSELYSEFLSCQS